MSHEFSTLSGDCRTFARVRLSLGRVLSFMEIWKPIAGYEGIYEVSNFGRINSLARLIIKKTGQEFRKQRYLKPSPNSKGYLLVTLCNSKKERKSEMVHDLVCSAFHVRPTPKHEVNHVDGIKANNLSSNLEFLTRAQNVQHAYDTGLNKQQWPKFKGSNHPNSKFTEAIILDIRRRADSGDTQTFLAKTFDTTVSVISAIINRRSWKHV